MKIKNMIIKNQYSKSTVQQKSDKTLLILCTIKEGAFVIALEIVHVIHAYKDDKKT